MARKKNNPKADPADLTLRVWVIERRWKGAGGWHLYDFCGTEAHEYDVIYRCEYLSREHSDFEVRYRAATLTFDDDGRKCVIY